MPAKGELIHLINTQTPRKKTRLDELRDSVRQGVEAATGTKDWDPVVMMAIVAEQARSGFPAYDENGRPILDKDGNQAFTPPDPALAVAAAGRVAPYLRPTVTSAPAPSEETTALDPETRKTAILARLEALGVKPSVDQVQQHADEKETE